MILVPQPCLPWTGWY